MTTVPSLNIGSQNYLIHETIKRADRLPHTISRGSRKIEDTGERSKRMSWQTLPVDLDVTFSQLSFY